ncbi:hypothetical protein M1N12_02790 [Peptococcaceae bacterium]|nr:hypothetical protein [Peptococcaceae bacterium]MCL0041971.1 hypothetical protein [Peptococcaceae bacterium]MCL0052388.1 hypothetical protein [Peptococcaceae bacterium]MCL0063237.1 hypothetical protein [Peptococcaceae bacterium]
MTVRADNDKEIVEKCKENLEFVDWSDVKILKKFYSKRNEVFLVKVGYKKSFKVVMKKYNTEKEAKREFYNLNYLLSKGINVPRPYKVNKNLIFMQYIEGKLLVDLLDTDLLSYKNWVKKLAYWFFKMHNVTCCNTGLGLLKGDVNLRNFIFHRGDFFGLDFERCMYGHPKRDIGEICAFLLGHYPLLTAEKFCIVRDFIHYYLTYNFGIGNFNADKPEIEREIFKSLERMAFRREKYLNDYSMRIGIDVKAVAARKTNQS